MKQEVQKFSRFEVSSGPILHFGSISVPVPQGALDDALSFGAQIDR